MSKADVTCPKCRHEWTYRGLSCSSCYCPNCSNRISLDAPTVEVLEHFGFAGKDDNLEVAFSDN